MPYIECQGCRAKFYTAARRVNADACPRCGLELAPAGHFSRDELRPMERATQHVLQRLRPNPRSRSL